MDDEWMETFLGYVRDGLPPYLACEASGVSRITFWRWWRLGGGATTADNPEFVDPEEADEPYAGFVARTSAAEAGLYAELTRTVTQKAKEDAEFGLKVLKSRRPEDWNPNRANQPSVVFQEGPNVTMTTEDFRRWQKGVCDD